MAQAKVNDLEFVLSSQGMNDSGFASAWGAFDERDQSGKDALGNDRLCLCGVDLHGV